MSNLKKNIIVFGASEGGKSFIKFQEEYNILAIADNNPKKHGTVLNGYLVIPPNEIFTYDYDFVVIASVFVFQIQQQLIETLNISQDKIKFAPKSQLKPSYLPFQDSKTLEFANRTLFDLIDEFERNQIKYFLDFGTLLGIVREGRLISWDDDIDISIHPDDIQNTIVLLKKSIQWLNSKEKVEWSGSVSYNRKDNPISIDLDFHSNEFKKFTINIGFIYFKDNLAVQLMNHAPKIHFETQGSIEYQNRKVSIPSNHEDYLTYTYGNWREEKKKNTFFDNALTFREPTDIFMKKDL